MDPLPYVLANCTLTLLDQQPREDNRAAAHSALTRRTGQPGALDARAADRWAGPAATLYINLNGMNPMPDLPTLPALPFQNRCHSCFPAGRLGKPHDLDSFSSGAVEPGSVHMVSSVWG